MKTIRDISDAPVDTLRLLISWQCNLRCDYCCNEIPRFRNQFKPTTIAALDFNKYANVCVSGGEPLLDLPYLENILKQIPSGKKVILYSNGIFLDAPAAKMLERSGVGYIRVGLHYHRSFDRLISDCTKAVQGTSLKVRFHAQDIYQQALTEVHPNVPFRFWKMDDCDRANEDRVILEKH